MHLYVMQAFRQLIHLRMIWKLACQTGHSTMELTRVGSLIRLFMDLTRSLVFTLCMQMITLMLSPMQVPDCPHLQFRSTATCTLHKPMILKITFHQAHIISMVEFWNTAQTAAL